MFSSSERTGRHVTAGQIKPARKAPDLPCGGRRDASVSQHHTHRPRIAGPDHKITGALTPLHIRDGVYIKALWAGVDNSAPNIGFMGRIPSGGCVLKSALRVSVVVFREGRVAGFEYPFKPLIPAKAGIQFIRKVALRASLCVCWIPDQVRDDMGVGSLNPLSPVPAREGAPAISRGPVKAIAAGRVYASGEMVASDQQKTDEPLIPAPHPEVLSRSESLEG